jgi:4-amino-4-deoxy-L-arabinose transferase-like glycosyltransferase
MVPVSPDEAYYWVWSKALAPGYFDHPPMVALWIWLGTALAGNGAFGIRLLGPLSAALGSLLLADAGGRLFPQTRPGARAALLFNATLVMGLGAATMTPDTPLLFFWTAGLWAAARAYSTGRGEFLALAGLCAGLAMASKYTGVFLGAGLVLWLLYVPPLRRWLATPWPWLGLALGLAAFAPVLWWNAAHGWVSFLRQGGRVQDFAPAKAAGYLLELFGGQFALATPLLFALFAAGMALAWRRALAREPRWALLACVTLPAALVFAEHAFGDRVQGNWPAILYPAAAIAAMGLTGFWVRLRAPAIAAGLLITAAVYAQAAGPLLKLPAHYDPTTRVLGGWPAFAANAAADAVSLLASDEFGIAAELARLSTCRPPITVLAVGDRWRYFNLPHPDLTGQTVVIVRSARRDGPPDGKFWQDLTQTGELDRARDGVTAERYRIYHAKVAGPQPEIVALPSICPEPPR